MTVTVPDDYLDPILSINGRVYTTVVYRLSEEQGRSGGAGAEGPPPLSRPTWFGDRLVIPEPWPAKFPTTMTYSLDGDRLKLETRVQVSAVSCEHGHRVVHEGEVSTNMSAENAMRRLAVAALIAAGLIVSAWQIGRAQTKVNEFQIVVSPAATGLKAHCVKGCTWGDAPTTAARLPRPSARRRSISCSWRREVDTCRLPTRR